MPSWRRNACKTSAPYCAVAYLNNVEVDVQDDCDNQETVEHLATLVNITLNDILLCLLLSNDTM
jgi:hypothetical protein